VKRCSKVGLGLGTRVDLPVEHACGRGAIDLDFLLDEEVWSVPRDRFLTGSVDLDVIWLFVPGFCTSYPTWRAGKLSFGLRGWHKPGGGAHTI
jgi:hypothetical protein